MEDSIMNDWITSQIYEMSDISSKWESKCYGIYAIFSKTTNKRYVGQTAHKKGFSGRWQDHRELLRKNQHDNIYLQRSYNKRGEKDFYFIVLEIINDKSLLDSREYHWMERLKSMFFQSGWNIDTYDRYERRKNTYRPKQRNLVKYEFISPTGEIVKGENLEEFAKLVGGFPENFNKVHHGKAYSYLGYKSTNPEFHRKYKTYKLVSPNGEIKEFNNICEFSRQNGLTFTNISKVLLGKTAHAEGWHLENPLPKYLKAIQNYQFKYVKSPDGVFYKFRSIRKFLITMNLIYRYRSFSRLLTNKIYNYNGWIKISEKDVDSKSIIEI